MTRKWILRPTLQRVLLAGAGGESSTVIWIDPSESPTDWGRSGAIDPIWTDPSESETHLGQEWGH